MYNIYHTPSFLKDFKRCVKKHWDIALLEESISVLTISDEKCIPAKYNDHILKGKYRGQRELHIGGRNSDWLLVYKIEGNTLYLARTGTHDEIFK